MANEMPRTLWVEGTDQDIETVTLTAFERDLGIRFFGLARSEESIIGHRVLRNDRGDATILRVRRRFDSTGFFVELVSSMDDEALESWEGTRQQVRQILAKLESDRDVLAAEVFDAAPTWRLERNLMQPFSTESAVHQWTPDRLEGIRYTALFVAESMGEELVKEIGKIDERVAQLRARLEDPSTRFKASSRLNRTVVRSPLRTIQEATSDEVLRSLPAVGALTLGIATGVAAWQVLKALAIAPIATSGAIGITSIFVYIGVLLGTYLGSRKVRRSASDMRRAIAILASSIVVLCGFSAFFFFAIALTFYSAVLCAVLAAAALASFARLAYSRTKLQATSGAGSAASPTEPASYELREELEVLRVRRRTVLRAYATRANAASAMAKRERSLLYGDEEGGESPTSDESWASPSWLRWATEQLEEDE
jgi:hypothetical protein